MRSFRADVADMCTGHRFFFPGMSVWSRATLFCTCPACRLCLSPDKPNTLSSDWPYHPSALTVLRGVQCMGRLRKGCQGFVLDTPFLIHSELPNALCAQSLGKRAEKLSVFNNFWAPKRSQFSGHLNRANKVRPNCSFGGGVHGEKASILMVAQPMCLPTDGHVHLRLNFAK